MSDSIVHTPLVRLGQGAFARDIRPADLSRPEQAAHELDLEFLIREPGSVYHAGRKDHLSSHALADFRRCPKLYRRKQLGLVPERDSTAYALGRAAHVLILEGRERFEAEFAVGGPINPKTGQPFGAQTKAFAQWAASVGKPVLSDADAALLEQMHAGVRDHLFATELLRSGVAEGVVRAEYGGVPCQARIDWVNPIDGRGVVDLKTCSDLDEFERDVHRYGYVHQMAFYRELVVEACGVELEVHLVAIEKREPYRCGVWQLSRRLLDRAADENLAAVDELKRCREHDIWKTRFESLRLIDIEAPAPSSTHPQEHS
ncbi:MAG: PD-(D/E)XK nuclease-like domain-containing protein [Planctomycetota bacterium]